MTKTMPHPKALTAPETPITRLNTGLVSEAVTASRLSPRGRVILPLHKSHDAGLHCMLNAMQPGTYVRPHRHSDPPKAESFILLAGAIRVVTFSEEGVPEAWTDLHPGGVNFGVDLEPGIFHSLIALEPDTVIFEVKPGPYSALSDKDFAPWAPEEGSSEVGAYLAELIRKTSISA